MYLKISCLYSKHPHIRTNGLRTSGWNLAHKAPDKYKNQFSPANKTCSYIMRGRVLEQESNVTIMAATRKLHNYNSYPCVFRILCSRGSCNAAARGSQLFAKNFDFEFLFSFFFTAAHFSPCWLLAFLIFSLPLQNFHPSSSEIRLLCFISRAIALSLLSMSV